ncbi:MAG: glycosyltransferase family 2 protein [Clostridiales bacterium]|nr:glycosyltransferase family 2 protein [Clostridiales bacterium]
MVLQSPIRIQVLVSAVDKEADELYEKMNIDTDAVIVNQCGMYDYKEFEKENCRVQCFSMKERGVGLSRNTALLHADADICLFSDEDIVFSDGLCDTLGRTYEQYSDADMILFNVKVAPSRRTYWNEQVKRIRWYNYGRYPAYSISGKLDLLRRANVNFSLLFGGGAKYSNGEDSLFLRDCLRAGLKIYAVPVCIGEEIERESTWFHGYTEKFFTDRGVLYHYLYGKLSRLFALRFLLKNKEEMCAEIPFKEAYALMKRGIKSQR